MIKLTMYTRYGFSYYRKRNSSPACCGHNGFLKGGALAPTSGSSAKQIVAVIVGHHRQCWGRYHERIALQATNYFTLEEVELQQSYPREKSSLVN